MNSLADDFAAGLFERRGGPCLSIYQPTHRHHPGRRQDPIRFSNLVDSLERTLEASGPARGWAALIDPFRALAADVDFWSHTRDGLAVLGAPDFFRTYALLREVPERAVVADSFHLKPLLRVLQSADRYQILTVTRETAHLYEGNRDRVDEVDLAPGVPRTIEDALGREHSEPYHGLYSHVAGPRGAAMHHGHGGKKDEIDVDTERFFRAVDRGVLDHHSKQSGLPLLLAALPEYHGTFRSVSRNPHLMSVGLEVDASRFDAEELRERAWEVVSPAYLAKLESLVERFGEARSKGFGTDGVEPAAMAAVQGRVRTLLVDADRAIPGRLDASTGEVTVGADGDGGVDDLLDDVAEAVLARGGEVIVVPTERMPTTTGLAATFSY